MSGLGYGTQSVTPLFDPSLITFVKQGHEYYVEVDGTTIKPHSLSQLLKKTGLAPVYDKDIPEYVLEKARLRGESVHLAVQNHLTGKPWEVDSAHMSYLDNAQRLLEKHSIKAEMVETPLFNPIFDYACTPDLIGNIDGKPIVLDWKTSASPSRYHGFQVAGQALCFRNPEQFDLYVGDLKRGQLIKFDDNRYLRIAKEAFQLYLDVDELVNDV